MISKPVAMDLSFLYQGFCFEIRTATLSIGIYYVVTSFLVCIDLIFGVVKGKDFCGFIQTADYPKGERIFDTTTNFILVAVMIITSTYLLLGVRKYRERLLIPFIILLFLDIVLSVMSLFRGAWGLPGTFTYEEATVMWNYASVKHELSLQDTARLTMIFGVIFILYVLIKVYMMNCVMNCYTFIKLHNIQARGSKAQSRSTVVELPSYSEAVKLPSKDSPPEYQEHEEPLA
ncbi:mtp family protein [Amia ocellicauda]|uniref:mtp family protein n=1 Tax=Amia ocellicauda TaxID=2972642 RepID=UPI003463AD25